MIRLSQDEALALLSMIARLSLAVQALETRIEELTHADGQSDGPTE